MADSRAWTESRLAWFNESEAQRSWMDTVIRESSLLILMTFMVIPIREKVIRISEKLIRMLRSVIPERSCDWNALLKKHLLKRTFEKAPFDAWFP